MRHTEVLIMFLALLAKRPDGMDVFPPPLERMSISQIYAGSSGGSLLHQPARKGVKA